MSELALVCGAGGFIGGHLVKSLLDRGYRVRAVDIKPFDEWWQIHQRATNHQHVDLQDPDECLTACGNGYYPADYATHVFQLAADMGGMGFIETHKAACMLSVLINTNMIQAAKLYPVQRYFYASSACVYAADKQRDPNVTGLKEEDAYPAMPEDGYGWEKLFSERMCRHFREDYGIPTRVARFHNVYGPHGTWTGGREKAPAAICRKVAEAKLKGLDYIEIWGDGTKTRSFQWIDDCIQGIHLLTDSDIVEPLNIGSSEKVSINQLVDLVESIAGVKLERRYQLDQPQGVNGRNSDNTKIKALLGWEPSTPLKDGLKKTYAWIEKQYRDRKAGKRTVS